MKQTQLIMDMPVIIEIADPAGQEIFNKIFDYFRYVDNEFSTFKTSSEISLINEGKIKKPQYSKDMGEIFRLAQETKNETNGYFDIRQRGKIDPSGIVKGWAIRNAARMLKETGLRNYYVEAGGDIEVAGMSSHDEPWKIGIRNPFNVREMVKIVHLTHNGIATSGTYERGQHIYNPKTNTPADEVASITVIGPDVYEADRFATAAFAMGQKGITFIENQPGLEGYMIRKTGTAIRTSGFDGFTI